MRLSKLRALAAAMVLVSMADRAVAVDGQIEINEARAQEGGVTACDTPGYPISICESGVYILTSVLAVDGTTAITIGADLQVIIEMNGFSIEGPARCAGSFPSVTCSGHTVGPSGIVCGAGAKFAVRAGLIRGVRDTGIDCSAGLGAIVENVFVNDARQGMAIPAGSIVRDSGASRNADIGIQTGEGTQIRNTVVFENGFGTGSGNGLHAYAGSHLENNSASSNAGNGIVAGSGSVVRSNVANVNGGTGIQVVYGSSAIGNLANGNAIGIDFGSGGGLPPSGWADNVLSANTIDVQGTLRIPMGDNVCTGALCP